VPSDERRALDQDSRSAPAEVAKLEQAYGAAAVDSPEHRRPTMRGFEIAHSQIGKQLRAARERLSELLTRRRTLPQRVEVGDLSDGAVVKLATERKHLTNIIKMLAFQTESDLLAFLRPHYARGDDEGRTLLHELFHAAADIEVTDTELLVTICVTVQIPMGVDFGEGGGWALAGAGDGSEPQSVSSREAADAEACRSASR